MVFVVDRRHAPSAVRSWAGRCSTSASSSAFSVRVVGRSQARGSSAVCSRHRQALVLIGAAPVSRTIANTATAIAAAPCRDQHDQPVCAGRTPPDRRRRTPLRPLRALGRVRDAIFPGHTGGDSTSSGLRLRGAVRLHLYRSSTRCWHSHSFSESPSARSRPGSTHRGVCRPPSASLRERGPSSTSSDAPSTRR